MRKAKRQRKRAARTHMFDALHPAVLFTYFSVILVFTMLVVHPVYVTISFAAAFLLSVYLRGWTASLQTLAWQVPLVILIALINPMFSTAGSTELFSLGPKVVHAEEMIFGGSMGLMLVSVMLWFTNVANVMSSDKMMSMFGGKAPTLSFMLSATMRQIPQFVRRGKEIDLSAKACTAAAAQTHDNAFTSRVRLTSVLAAWSMEESIEMADAMKARGWGSVAKRSSYKRYRLRRRDLFSTGVITLLAGASFVLAFPALASFQFYPEMSTLSFHLGYIVFGILALMPFWAAGIDQVRWR